MGSTVWEESPKRCPTWDMDLGDVEGGLLAETVGARLVRWNSNWDVAEGKRPEDEESLPPAPNAPLAPLQPVVPVAPVPPVAPVAPLDPLDSLSPLAAMFPLLPLPPVEPIDPPLPPAIADLLLPLEPLLLELPEPSIDPLQPLASVVPDEPLLPAAPAAPEWMQHHFWCRVHHMRCEMVRRHQKERAEAEYARALKKRKKFSRRVKEEHRRIGAEVGRGADLCLSGAPETEGWFKRGPGRHLRKHHISVAQMLSLKSLHNHLIYEVSINFGIAVFATNEAYTTNQCIWCHEYHKGATYYRRHRRCPNENCPSHKYNVRTHREFSIVKEVVAADCQLDYLRTKP